MQPTDLNHKHHDHHKAVEHDVAGQQPATCCDGHLPAAQHSVTPNRRLPMKAVPSQCITSQGGPHTAGKAALAMKVNIMLQRSNVDAEDTEQHTVFFRPFIHTKFSTVMCKHSVQLAHQLLGRALCVCMNRQRHILLLRNVTGVRRTRHQWQQCSGRRRAAAQEPGTSGSQRTPS
jgi:hypothetical protein